MKKKSNYLAEGSYGCVISPGFDCLNKKIIKNTVAKLFINKYDFEKEILTNNIMNKVIDKSNNFTIKMISSCGLDDNYLEYLKKNVDNFSNCKNIKKKKENKIYQIIFENGGLDLETYMINNQNNIDIYYLLNEMIKIIFGIKFLIIYNILHADIKINNILFNGKKLSLIDFGFVQNINNFYNDYNFKWMIKNYIYYYPPEMQLFALLANNEINKKKIKINSLSLLKYLKEDIKHNKYIFNKYPNYFNEIKKINKFIKTQTESFYLKLKNKQIPNISDHYNELAKKIDIYQLGIVIYLIIIYIFIFKSSEIEKIPIDIFKIIKKMIDPDPFTRIDIDNLITEYSKLFTKKKI